VRCQVRPDLGGRLLRPLEAGVAEGDGIGSGSDAEDDLEEEILVKECAGQLYDLSPGLRIKRQGHFFVTLSRMERWDCGQRSTLLHALHGSGTEYNCEIDRR
jgi:hypothetical protein